MLERNIDIAPLLVRYLEDGLSGAEHAQLMQWVESSDLHRAFFQDLQDPEKMRSYLEQYASIDPQKGFTDWKNAQPGQSPSPVHRIHFLRRWGWAAASLLLLCGAGTYLLVKNRQAAPPAIAKHNDIAPGRNGAILTLADGSQVVLDSLGNKMVATQNGAQVLLENGRLAYAPTGSASAEVMYNTMTTPKGRQFQVSLPDGTKVWLNAASSITYPTVFTGKQRKIKITGEVYLEVAKQADRPFLVNVNDKAGISVLGTSFNVNAYGNEASIRTTLLEGSVQVSNDKGKIALRPGQQAQIPNTGGIKTVDHADLDKVMAWKNGLFNFEGLSFEEAMRQLERWYDIEVVYENGIPDNIEMNGEITKGVTLNDLLVGLGKIGMKCRQEGRKLIVEN